MERIRRQSVSVNSSKKGVNKSTQVYVYDPTVYTAPYYTNDPLTTTSTITESLLLLSLHSHFDHLPPVPEQPTIAWCASVYDQQFPNNINSIFP